jgi:hypothetical protein
LSVGLENPASAPQWLYHVFFRQDQQDLQDLPQKSYPVDPVNPVKGHDLLDTTFKSIFVQQQEKKRSPYFELQKKNIFQLILS